jgi:hypothetical protein
MDSLQHLAIPKTHSKNSRQLLRIYVSQILPLGAGHIPTCTEKPKQTGPGTTQNAWYYGKTKGFGARYAGHCTFIKSPTEPEVSKTHYRMAQYCERPKSGWCAIKMLDIPDTIADQDVIMAIGEQALVLLMHSTNETLLTIRSAEEIELRGSYFKQAAALQNICRRVFPQVGWATSMPSVTGANWSMLMAETRTSEQAIWTRVLFPPSEQINASTRVAVFRRQSSRFNQNVLEGKRKFALQDTVVPRGITGSKLPLKTCKDPCK